ncbi:MAG: ribose-phosphate diphosphokinase [bacterium]
MPSSAPGGHRHVVSRGRGERVFSYGARLRDIRVANLGDQVHLLAGHSNPELAQKVADILHTDLIMSIGVAKFSDSEINVEIPRSVRSKPVHVMQAATPGEVNDNVMEVCLLLDALRRASSGERTVFFAPFPYQRKDRQNDQQRKGATRQPIAARLAMDMMEIAGAQRFQTLDLHADQEAGFTDLPFDPLFASKVLIPHIRNRLPEGKKKALSPDHGGLERARKYFEFLGLDGFGYAYKTRGAEGVEVHDILGDVAGCHVLLVDDVISTGESGEKAAKLAHSKGALSVTMVATHGQFIDVPGKPSSLQRLENAGIEKIYVTDTIRHRDAVVNHPLIEVVTVAPLVAQMIKSAAFGHPIHDFVE